MKQRLILIIVGGFFSCYILLVLNAAFYQFIYGSTGAYDALPMALYLGPFYAGLFCVFVVLSAALVFNKLCDISFPTLVLLNACLAQIGIVIHLVWGRFVIPYLDKLEFHEKFGDLVLIISMITPFFLTLITCVIGYRVNSSSKCKWFQK